MQGRCCYIHEHERDLFGCINIEVEFVSIETRYTITIEQPQNATITLKNKKNDTIVNDGNSVNAGDVVIVSVSPEEGYILDDVWFWYEGTGVGHRDTTTEFLITADTRINVKLGKCEVFVNVNWLEENSVGQMIVQVPDGMSLSSEYGNIRTVIISNATLFKVLFDSPGAKIVSLLVYGEEKISEIKTDEMQRFVYEHILQAKEVKIQIEAKFGKDTTTYVKEKLDAVDNAVAQLSYTLSGNVITIEEGKEGYVPEGTDITVTVAPENGYEVSSVKAGDATVTAANGEYKYTVSADTTFTITTAQKQNHVILSADATSIRVATTAAFTVSGGAIAATGTAFDLKLGDTKYATVFVPNDPVTTGAAISLEGRVTVDQMALVDVLDFSAFSSSNTGDALFTSYVLDEILKKFNRVATVYYPEGVSAKPQGFVGNQTFSAKPNS